MPSVKTQNQPIQTFMLLLWSGWMMTYPFLQVWKRWIVTQSFLNFASLVKNICHLYIIKETQECQSHRGELQSTAFQWEIRSCLYYGYIFYKNCASVEPTATGCAFHSFMNEKHTTKSMRGHGCVESKTIETAVRHYSTAAKLSLKLIVIQVSLLFVVVQ